MRQKIIFVHGLGGSAKSTWGKFSDISETAELTDCEFYYYEYPTFPIRIPFFQSKYGSIQDLAKGLKTFIDNKLESGDNIVLVGHSLGGLIIRKYLLEEKLSGAELRVQKVLLYAVPHSGSGLANIADILSWKHRQLKQLCKDSEFLDQLNDSWVASKLDDQLIIRCVIGLADKVVGSESQKGFCRRYSPEVIPDKGHRNIIEPVSTDDMSFTIFKRFLEELFPITKAGVRGALLYHQWASMEEISQFAFLPDENRKRAIGAIRELIQKPKQSIRIVGMSGLGKTRLVYEAFNYELDTHALSKQVLYIDMAIGFDELPRTVAHWVTKGFSGILVLDNCDIEKHKQVAKHIKRADSNLSFISLDYNPDEDPDSKNIKVERLSNELIKGILAPVYGKEISDLDRIVEFAQGFPQMAALLSRARLNQDEDMGRLTDIVLVRKMLWGNDHPNEDMQKIIRCSALFDKFGLEGDASAEYEFIAEAVARVDVSSFYGCVKEFERRGVFDMRGRYVQLVPKPLAIHLAAEWWDTTPTKVQEELILRVMPGRLETSFCQQIKKLDFLPRVKELTADLCGFQSPFGQAEVILSDRGSSLFCALVEVNPKATSDVLTRVLTPLKHEQLLSINGEVRRNLVRALERLCFRDETFESSVRCLMLLASAENEGWSNNATGEFTQLFRIFLSGTEAGPEKRLALIDEALSADCKEINELAVKAMDAAIDTYGGTRTVGAEYQGSGEPLIEWRPRIWQEAFDYWGDILERLTLAVTRQSNVSSQAKMVIGSHIRELMQYGRVSEIDKALSSIVEVDGPFWPEALESIKISLSYDSEKMPKEGVVKLQEWMKLLTPDSLSERIKLIVSIPSYENEKVEGDHYVDVAANNAEAFAKEFSEDISVLFPLLPDLLQGEQRKGYWFGRNLVLASNQYEPLLSESISFLENVEDSNPSFTYGLLNGLCHIGFDLWDSYIGKFGDSKKLTKFYPSALTTGEIKERHLNLIIELIRDQYMDVSAVSSFTYGRALDGVDVAIVISFISKLKRISNNAAWMALQVLSMYCHGDKNRWQVCEDTFKDILVNLSLVQTNNNQQLDTYHWCEAAKKLLTKEDSRFAQRLVERILEGSGETIGYGDLMHYVKPVMRMILANYGVDVWPIVSEAVKTDDVLMQYRMTQLFSHEDVFHREGRSVLSDLDDLLLFQWCRSEPEFAPSFLARSTEVIENNDGTYTLSSRARFLIDEFGDSEQVLAALSSNMDSFGWCGSVVPHYKNEVEVLSPLTGHLHKRVREWTSRRINYLNDRIAAESLRDEEQSWGIY